MKVHCRPISAPGHFPAKADEIRCELCGLPLWQQVLYGIYYAIVYGLLGKTPPTE